MARASFLFVNKDAKSKSFSHSTRAERSTINQHVQKGLRHSRQDPLGLTSGERKRLHSFPFRRKSEVEDGSGTSGTDGRSSPIIGTDTSAGSESDEAEAIRKKFAIAANEVDALVVGPKSESARSWMLDRNPGITRKRAVTNQLALAQPNAIDPFNVHAISLDPTVCELMQYFVENFARPSKWQMGGSSSALTLSKATIQERAIQHFRGSLQDEMTIYCLLSYAGSLRINQDGAHLEPLVRQYIHKAILATKARLEAQPHLDEGLVMNIFLMCSAEWLAFRGDEWYIHMRLVKQLVDQMGGLSTLNETNKENVLLGDGFFAADRLTLPVFPCDFDPGPPDAAAVKWMLGNNIRSEGGQGFLESAAAFIPDHLRRIVVDLAQTSSILAADQDAPPAILHWIHLRNLAIRHRMLTLMTVDRRTSALRLALLIWILMVVFRTVRRMLWHSLAPRLREILTSTGDEMWHGHAPMMVWIQTIGSMASQPGSEVEKWFSAKLGPRLHDVVRPEGDVFEYLSDLSNGFFYLHRVQRPMMQRVVAQLSSTGV